MGVTGIYTCNFNTMRNAVVAWGPDVGQGILHDVSGEENQIVAQRR